METWRILSNYQTFGLAWTVQTETARIMRKYPVLHRARAYSIARKRALISVRTALVQAINKGIFHVPA